MMKIKNGTFWQIWIQKHLKCVFSESHVMCSVNTLLTIAIKLIQGVTIDQLIIILTHYQVCSTAHCYNYTEQTTPSLITTINILKQ